MNDTLRQVKFDIIRYANCWEDAGVLLRALHDKPAARIAIIASGGDNALALLSGLPEKVLAFDISLPQLYLCELKQVAIARLEYDELLVLLGVSSSLPQQRMQLFNHVSVHLSADALTFWKDRKTVIESGVIHCGKFERYFRMFRTYCLPLVHSRKMVNALLQPKDDEAQAAFYHRHWNNLRWRLLVSLFFSKTLMGKAGRDPQFLKHVALSVPKYIRRKAETHLQLGEATRNHLLQYIFTGNFRTVLPHYLRPENHTAIRANISRLTLQQASADDVVKIRAHDAYCLSNIFEYFSQEQFNATVNEWRDLLPSGARLLFWNLMLSRSFALQLPDTFRKNEQDPLPDAGFFYSAFLNEERL